MIEDKLREKEPLLQIIVSERARANPNIREDMLQEARIEAWSQMEKEASPALVSHAVRQRVSRLVTQGNWTGKPAKRDRGSKEPLDTDRDSIDDPDWDVHVEAADVLEAVEWAYHHGEILEALRSLPERHREYVLMRFWGGMTNAEIAAHQDVRLGNISRTWNEAIKPKLAEQLEHLADAIPV